MKINFCIVFCFLSQMIFSQIEDSTSVLIKTYENEINEYESKLRIIDNMEFRSNVNRFENMRTSFQLRVILNSYKILRTKEEEIAVTKELKKNSLLIERNKILKSHYEDIIKYYEIDNQQHDTKKSLEKCQKIDSLYNVYIRSYQKIDYKDYITNKQTLINLEYKLNGYHFMFDSIKKNIAHEVNLKKLKDINFQNLKDKIESIKKSNLNNLSQNNQKLQIDLIQSNINHVTAKKNQIVENIIFSHNLRDDLIVNDRFSFGVRLKLPWFDSANKNTINKLQFEKKMEEFKSKILNENIDFELNKIFIDFEINFNNYQNVLKHIDNKSWIETYDLIVSSGKISIFEIIEFEKFNLNIQRELNEYRIIMLNLYLEALSLNGQVEQFKEIFKN
jgi:hypothetical protein